MIFVITDVIIKQKTINQNTTRKGKTMASIEYLEKRIAGKTAELEKLNKKMERIKAAEATNWEVNPYYYHKEDLKWTGRYIEAAEKALADYREKLNTAKEKAGSRNVPVITEFLENWKAETRNFYIEQVPKYKEAAKEYSEKRSELNWWSQKGETRKQMEKEWNHLKDRFEAEWGWIAVYMYAGNLELDRLERDLKNEADRKYDFIIERTNAIVGQITDASRLHVMHFELNGEIKGTKGTAYVQTISAGGWNIQRYHFRTLISKAE